ncbi:MAG TPA: hypothetical protein VIC53_01050 [Wenzhouxiangella sp.]
MTAKTRSCFKAPDQVVVVRVPQDHLNFAHACECIAQGVKKGYSVQVFLHGPAVGAWLMDDRHGLRALADEPQVRVGVCQAAWQRLVRDQGVTDNPPYPVMSLIAIWDAMGQATAVSCFGWGQWPDHEPSAAAEDPRSNRESEGQGAQTYGVMIAYGPSSADRDSLLEWVLAGATLDLDLVVAFAGDGASELKDEPAKRWAQVKDHGLAKVVTESIIAQDNQTTRADAHIPLSGRKWLVM